MCERAERNIKMAKQESKYSDYFSASETGHFLCEIEISKGSDVEECKTVISVSAPRTATSNPKRRNQHCHNNKYKIV